MSNVLPRFFRFTVYVCLTLTFFCPVELFIIVVYYYVVCTLAGNVHIVLASCPTLHTVSSRLITQEHLLFKSSNLEEVFIMCSVTRCEP